MYLGAPVPLTCLVALPASFLKSYNKMATRNAHGHFESSVAFLSQLDALVRGPPLRRAAAACPPVFWAVLQLETRKKEKKKKTV